MKVLCMILKTRNERTEEEWLSNYIYFTSSGLFGNKYLGVQANLTGIWYCPGPGTPLSFFEPLPECPIIPRDF